MTNILSWGKPARAVDPTEFKRRRMADGAPPGVYGPNMSEEDRVKWRAKKVSGTDPRVEIRKGLANGALLVLIIRPDGSVTLSTNNKVVLDAPGWDELCACRDEALQAMGQV